MASTGPQRATATPRGPGGAPTAGVGGGTPRSRQGRVGGSRQGPESGQDTSLPSSLQSQLQAAQGELQSTLDTRLQKEIADLTIRYSGDAVQAERVARARSERGFAASDPDFATEIAPLQQKVTDLEEQIRRAGQRRSIQTIGGNGGGETLG